MKNSNEKTTITEMLSKFIESHAFQLAAQALTVVGLLLAAYVTARLAPLSASLADHDFRIRAIEIRNEKADPSIDQVLIIGEQNKTTREDIQEIKGGMKELNEKMDRIIERL